jgi:hypothetical protein
VPLSQFQGRVLQLIAANRNPDSYFAGGAVINAAGPRFSDDFDVFHDRTERLAAAVAADSAAIEAAGFAIDRLVTTATFQRARIGSGDEAFHLDWVVDSDFRFFPLEPDPLFGFRLHILDIATNKVLAAAGRNLIRDVIDLRTLTQSLLPLGPLVWAASGKDAGLTPWFILQEFRRTARYRQDEVDELALTEPIDATALSREMKAQIEEATEFVDRLPLDDLGCLYLDAEGNPTAPDPARLQEYRRHFGSRGGHWPTSSEILSEMTRREV